MQKRREEREAKKRQKETSKQSKSKQQKKDTTLSTKGKGKQKANVNESEAMDADKCPICDMKWLGCECGQWLHEECIDYVFENSYLVCPNCVEQ